MASLLVPLASCLNASDNSNNLFQYGALAVTGLGGGTQVSATANGIFFEALAANIPDSRTVQNTCVTGAVESTASPAQGELKAGAALSMLSGAGSGKVTTTLAFNSLNVSYLGTAGFTYKSGDSATVLVPGETGGFPASSVTVRLAEPIIPEDITVPNASADMPVRWNVGDSTSAIILSIQYANPASSASANEQLVCSLKDDGNETVPFSSLALFINSPADKRAVRLTRWRTSVVQPTARSVLHIVSSTDSAAKLK